MCFVGNIIYCFLAVKIESSVSWILTLYKLSDCIFCVDFLSFFLKTLNSLIFQCINFVLMVHVVILTGLKNKDCESINLKEMKFVKDIFHFHTKSFQPMI